MSQKSNAKFSKLVNNDSKQGTLNQFLCYKESFSPKLFETLNIDFKFGKNITIFDPFVGTGSIFINDGIQKCFGEDVNPLSVLITNAKLLPINFNEAKKFINKINKISVPIRNYAFPKWKPFKKYVPHDRYNFVKSLIEFCKNKSFGEFIKMVIISNLPTIFNYKHDGNGIKFRQSKLNNNQYKNFIFNLVKNALQTKINFDKNNVIKYVQIFNKSSTIYNSKIKNVDLIITSPPYCNMFDYFDIYKIELWTLGIVENNADLTSLKKSALRNNANANINTDKIESTILKQCISDISKQKFVKKQINMINNYFFDMNLVLKNCYKYLKNHKYAFIVVGNSFYNTKPLKTDLIIQELACRIGFKKIDLITARKLSTSSQQMRQILEKDKKFLRESIVVLQKE